MNSHTRYKISNIPVVYEDDWLLIMLKPSGLLTIPTPKKELRTLTSILNADFKNRGLFYRAHPCHRLDRETSGLIVYAKGKSVQKKMMDIFRNRKVKKRYIVFVQGIPVQSKGEIGNSIEGLSAITKYKIIEKKENFAILEAIPLTGRTNQLRIHFKQIGHPILGETKFAFRRDFRIKAKRLCLHAVGLEFVHPVTAKFISLSVELPDDLKMFLKSHD